MFQEGGQTAIQVVKEKGKKKPEKPRGKKKT